MKSEDLKKFIIEQIDNKYNEFMNKIIENPEDYYHYQNGEIKNIASFENQQVNPLLEDLKKGDFNDGIIIDNLTKENIEKYKTKISHSNAKRVIIISSYLGDIFRVVKDKVVIDSANIRDGSVAEGPVLIEGGMIRDSIIGSHSMCKNSILNKNSVMDICRLDDGVFLNAFTVVSCGVWIKPMVTIAPNCTIIPGSYEDHCPFQYYLKGRDPENILEINTKAWIGSNVSIIVGVNIGAWSIISSSSVVKNDIDDFSLYIDNQQKSIVDRFYRNKNDIPEVVNKMLYFKNTIGDFLFQAKIYDYAKDKLRDLENSDLLMRFFYIYVHSNLMNKTVDLFGNSINIRCDEYLLEFFSPENIFINLNELTIDFKYRDINIDNYDEVIFTILQTICSGIGIVDKKSNGSYELKINDKHLDLLYFIGEKIDEGIRVFNSGNL